MFGRRPELKICQKREGAKYFEKGVVGTNIKSGPGIALRPTWRCRNVTKATSGADDIANILDPNDSLLILSISCFGKVNPIKTWKVLSQTPFWCGREGAKVVQISPYSYIGGYPFGRNTEAKLRKSCQLQLFYFWTIFSAQGKG